MEAVDFITSFKEILVGLGLPGLVIAVLLLGIFVLWRAYQQALGRNKQLSDRMLDMSKEVVIMIERITGR